uniref:Predicted protein n=1 Tax=Hordeum vulgare subsp. vulgare TaxID=112509 RepID=F2ELS2_HORVV|nr:predicted protein [Hordeum vulgare subsp. vulgare]
MKYAMEMDELEGASIALTKAPCYKTCNDPKVTTMPLALFFAPLKLHDFSCLMNE